MKPLILLDSGAYSAHTRGVIINIDQYMQFVEENKNIFDFAINLDVIGDARKSYENWRYLINNGASVLPVFHHGTSEVWLKKYLQKTDYIAYGALVGVSTRQKIISMANMWKTYFLDTNNNPICRIHGLGLTSVDLIRRYPWHSVDSTTPIIAGGFGEIWLPSIKNGDFNYTEGSRYLVSDQLKGGSNSFTLLPHSIQKKYEALFNINGFKLGEMLYKTKAKTKKDKKNKDIRLEGMFIMPEVIKEDGTETLANSARERKKWNILVWNEIQKNMPKYTYQGKEAQCSIYIVGDEAITLSMEMKICSNILVSYAYIKISTLNILKKYKYKSKKIKK